MNHTRPFNLRMDAVTRARFNELCKEQDLNGAQLVRQLINDRWVTLKLNTPRCASGAPCCMPAVYMNNQVPAMAATPKSPGDNIPATQVHELFAKEPPPVPNWSPAET